VSFQRYYQPKRSYPDDRQISFLRRTVRSALDDGQLLAAGAFVFSLDAFCRLILASTAGVLLLVVWPPVIPVVLFGLGGRYRSLTTESGRSGLLGAGGWLGTLAPLLLVAVVGHAFAVVGGLALFVVVDTPLRAFVYWVGLDALGSELGISLVVVGLMACMALLWAVPAVVAAAVAVGTPLSTALKRTLLQLAPKRRTFERVGVLTVGAFVTIALGVRLTMFLFERDVFAFLPVATTALGWLLSFVLTLVVLSTFSAVAGAVTVKAATGGRDELDLTPPRVAVEREGSQLLGKHSVGTLALAVLLTLSLVTVAGGARLTELRPMDESPEPEELDVDGNTQLLYGTALQNTAQQTHAGARYDLLASEKAPEARFVFDRAGRQILTEGRDIHLGHYDVDASTVLTPSIQGHSSSHPDPTSAPLSYGDFTSIHRLPHRETASELDVTVEDETIVLETRDAETVADTWISSVEPEEIAETNAAWLEIVIDRETNTIETVHFRLDVVVAEADGDREDHDEHYRWEFTTDPDIDRLKTALDSGGVVWKLLLY
jgi:hypothetical protein